MSNEQTALLEKNSILNHILDSMKLGPLEEVTTAIIDSGFGGVNENVSNQMRFLASLSLVLGNVDQGEGFLDRGKIQELIHQTNKLINDQINEIIHNPQFQSLEATWRGLYNLLEKTNFRA